jgi:hypothetical protein
VIPRCLERPFQGGQLDGAVFYDRDDGHSLLLGLI